MRSVPLWNDKVPEKDGISNAVYGLAFKPDGTQLIAAAGNRVLVYDTAEGELLHPPLKGHKDTVYCVDFSHDGKRFASGGADCTVIIWTDKAEGKLKYTHNESIQCVVYNPISQMLASCTSIDFGLWSPDQKSVAKHKVNSKITCASWTNDGQFLALGMMNGAVSIREKSGVEKVVIERKAPIWTLSFNPSKEESMEVLAVGCWDQTMSFYQLSGMQVGKDRELKYDPCSLDFFSNGEYICMGGSDRKVSLYTKEGVKLNQICETKDWVWACRAKPKQNYIAVGCNDGTIAVHQLIFNTVHGMYKDRYAYRDFMTDVIIQHLVTEQKVRIKCRDYVKKIAVYHNRLALQLPDKVIIYELSYADSDDMKYRVFSKLNKKLDCNLLVVTTNNLVLCQEKRLQMLNFNGVVQREWVLETQIRYIKVIGGPAGREGLLVGLKNGNIVKIFVDNQFPVPLVKHDKPVRCLDMSASRLKLAVVDDTQTVSVYDLRTKDIVFTEKDANSVAWNCEFEDMLAFGGNGTLSIRTGSFPLHQQKLVGFVVGFRGSKLYCLQFVNMNITDVPQSTNLYRYIEKKDFKNAYRVACLGVTQADWNMLGMEALAQLEFDMARKSFVRARDIRLVDLVNQLEKQHNSDGKNANDQLYVAEVLSYQGKYQEAAKVYSKIGHVERAIDMFSDLRQWEEAKQFAATTDSVNVKDLIRRQAEWSEEIGEWQAAANMYVLAGEHLRAINIMGERGWFNELIDVARSVSKLETRALGMCASYFRKAGHHQFAKECYVKMGDTQELMKLHLEFQRWDDAFGLLEQHPDYANMVHLPYAHWLSENDRFDEAQEAFVKAGKPEFSLRMLQQLTHNAIVETRYADGAYYYWLLGQETLKMISEEDAPTQHDQACIRKFREYYSRSELYYAYDKVYSATVDPFTKSGIETLFNICRFLLNRLTGEPPMGISRVFIVKTLAECAKRQDAFKLSRTCYDKLQTLRLPAKWKTEKSNRMARWSRADEVDLESLTIRSRPLHDSDLVQSENTCYRCFSKNPLLNPQGDVCATCRHRFSRCRETFDQLPVVEFRLEDGISDEQALELINMDPPERADGAGKDKDKWTERQQGNVQTLSFDETPDEEIEDPTGDVDDPFMKLLMSMEQGDASGPPVVSADMLKSFNRNDVFVKRWESKFLPWQYFRSVDNDTPIHLCCACNHFFREEEYERAVLETKKCPFCRVALDEEVNSKKKAPARSKWSNVKEMALGDVEGGASSQLAYVAAIAQKAQANSLL